MSEYGPIPANHICVYPMSVNSVDEIIQHAISFDRRERATNWILSMGPRLRRDATAYGLRKAVNGTTKMSSIM